MGAPDLSYVDDPTCRDVYADIVQVVHRFSGILRFEFSASRWTQGPLARVDRFSPVARVAMPLDIAKLLYEQLGTSIANLENAMKAAPDRPTAETRQ